MKWMDAELAAAWLSWFGAALLIFAGALVVAALVFTRGVDELSRTVVFAAVLALPGLVATVVGRMATKE